MTSTLDSTAAATYLDRFQADWRDWRAARIHELAVPYGWLTLAGFHWLPAEPAELAAELSGTFAAADGRASLRASAVDGYRLVATGEPVDGEAVGEVAEGGSLSWLERGGARVELLRRGGRDAIRLRTAGTDVLRDFRGVPAYPADPDWVLQAVFNPLPAPESVTVETARPDLLQQVTVVGRLNIEIAGVAIDLAVTGVPGSYRLSFRDSTSGHETAPWRTVPVQVGDRERVKAVGNDGVDIVTGTRPAVVDFNRAANLPFAFTDFGTCPAPVPGNRLTVPVKAGEKAPYGSTFGPTR